MGFGNNIEHDGQGDFDPYVNKIYFNGTKDEFLTAYPGVENQPVQVGDLWFMVSFIENDTVVVLTPMDQIELLN